MASSEHKVRLADVGTKQYNIMRFKHPHRCDLATLINPTLERKEVHMVEEEIAEHGEGSEYGKKRRDEARRRKRGIMSRKAHPDDQPWILKEQKKGGRTFVGRKEGGINQSAAYFVLVSKENGDFEAYPISNWYDFAPPVKYKFLNDEEAEAQFEKRNNTLNFFSVMVNKRIKDKEKEMETGMPSSTVDTFDDGGSASDNSAESFDEDDKVRTSTSRRKVPKRKPSQHQRSSEDGGEDTDEGEVESREVDYFTDTSSESEDERVKQLVKEEPRDDAEVERKEEAGIDQAFAEASSSEEDEELTERGKELKALIKKQLESEKEEEDAEEGQDDSFSSPEKEPFRKSEVKRVPSPVKGDVADDKIVKSRPPQKREAESPTEALPSASVQAPPPPKKPRVAEPTVDANVITKEEIQKYLSRKPITSKQLVKKFVKLKPAMDKQRIVAVLGKILQTMPNIEKRELEGKLHLSLCPEQEQS